MSIMLKLWSYYISYLMIGLLGARCKCHYAIYRSKVAENSTEEYQKANVSTAESFLHTVSIPLP